MRWCLGEDNFNKYTLKIAKQNENQIHQLPSMPGKEIKRFIPLDLRAFDMQQEITREYGSVKIFGIYRIYEQWRLRQACPSAISAVSPEPWQLIRTQCRDVHEGSGYNLDDSCTCNLGQSCLQPFINRQQVQRVKTMSHGMRFSTMWHLTCVDSDEPLQPPFKLRNSKWCSVSSLTIIEYSSD